jgi:hypothetical protein
VNYKLRDWLFARQRYWGEPIPVVFLQDTGETAPILETDLPLTLPELDDFTPTGTEEPPLAKAVSWVCCLLLTMFLLGKGSAFSCFTGFIITCECSPQSFQLLEHVF